MFSNLYKEPTISYSQKQKAKLQIIGHKPWITTFLKVHFFHLLIIIHENKPVIQAVINNTK